MTLKLLPDFDRSRLGIAATVAGLAAFVSTWAQPAHSVGVNCDYRAASQEIGQMPSQYIDEASGLVSLGEGRFFVINDSGDLPRFFRIDVNHSPAKVEDFRIVGWKPFDLEDLSIGPCPSPTSGECLALADIGDNRESRSFVSIGFFALDSLPEKTASKPVPVKPVKVVRLKYPAKSSYNAEAFAILDRDVGVIVTKSQSRKSREAESAKVFEVDLLKGEMRLVGIWEVPDWVKDRGLAGLVTGMSVLPSERGNTERRVLLLTYQKAVEINVSMTKVQDPKAANYWKVVSRRVLGLDYLEQQEAIAYSKDGGFFYTTELPLKFLGQKTAPIRFVEKVKCP